MNYFKEQVLVVFMKIVNKKNPVKDIKQNKMKMQLKI